MQQNQPKLSIPKALTEGLKVHINSFGEVFVHQDDAQEFLDRCSKQGFGLFGYDAMYIEHDSIQPILDYVLDLSDLYSARKDNPEAKAFSIRQALLNIQRIDPKENLYFSFVMAD